MRTPQFIMIHHSLTKDGNTVSTPAIEKYHKEVDMWSDIGYHALVEDITGNPELEKYKYQALIGRSLDTYASACPQGDMNRIALHVCCVGNYDIIKPDMSMLKVLLHRVIMPWAREFGIPPNKWVGHRDYNSLKSCPGKLFDINLLRIMGG